MNEKHFEELLPAYLEGDLDEATRAQVEAALAGSAELRASLDAYRSLDDALVMRREMVPPAAQFLTWLPGRAAAPAHAYSRMHRFIDAVLSWPALAALGFVVLGMWSYWNQSAIATFFNEGRVDTSGFDSSMTTINHGFNALLAALSRSDMNVMIGIYGLVTIAILAATGVITMRFVRSE